MLLSGGQDSTTALFWALQRFDSVEVITFNYGQRHIRELDCAAQIAKIAHVPQKIITLDVLSQLTSNAMMSDHPIEINKESQLPTTFVPGRNLLFVTLAATYAYERKMPNIVIGVSQVDYSGYPDCREETLKSLEKTITLGMAFPFMIHAPLLYKSKQETVLLAKDLGALDYMAYTHTCYKGESPPCGLCPACQLRAKGFEVAGIVDPIYDQTRQRSNPPDILPQ